MKIIVIAVEEKEIAEAKAERMKELEERVDRCQHLIHDMNMVMRQIGDIEDPRLMQTVSKIRDARTDIINNLKEARAEISEIRWEAGSNEHQSS